MLDENFLKKQKALLLKEEIRLENELKNLKKFPEIGTSDEDNAQEIETFGEYRGLEPQLSAELIDVKLALSKITNGTYGFCKNCNKPIEKERLEAYPAATTCIKCDK